MRRLALVGTPKSHSARILPSDWVETNLLNYKPRFHAYAWSANDPLLAFYGYTPGELYKVGRAPAWMPDYLKPGTIIIEDIDGLLTVIW